jgi:NitT/TauT family transport system permease protein
LPSICVKRKPAVILVIGALEFLLDYAARLVYRRFGAARAAGDE